MNQTLIVNGWNIGFQKVEFTKMLQSELGLGLTEAKAITDKVLNREQVELQINDQNYDRLTELVTNLGAVVMRKETEAACR